MPTIAAKTAALQKIDGFFPLYWDEAAGSLWLEIPRLGEEVLYVSGLSAGIGSNDIGLDRGQLGGTRLVRFERIGPRVLMIQPNTRYRAVNGTPDERRAVEASRPRRADACWVYYVDRGAPEPIRAAIQEGVGRWNQAFEAAGYRGGFRAELMPEDADPMDVRYNVRPFEPARPVALPSPPPGAPIGDPDQWWFDASREAGSWWWGREW